MLAQGGPPAGLSPASVAALLEGVTRVYAYVRTRMHVRPLIQAAAALAACMLCFGSGGNGSSMRWVPHALVAIFGAQQLLVLSGEVF